MYALAEKEPTQLLHFCTDWRKEHNLSTMLLADDHTSLTTISRLGPSVNSSESNEP